MNPMSGTLPSVSDIMTRCRVVSIVVTWYVDINYSRHQNYYFNLLPSQGIFFTFLPQRPDKVVSRWLTSLESVLMSRSTIKSWTTTTDGRSCDHANNHDLRLFNFEFHAEAPAVPQVCSRSTVFAGDVHANTSRWCRLKSSFLFWWWISKKVKNMHTRKWGLDSSQWFTFWWWFVHTKRSMS